jgi:hypothetical protein
MELALKYEQHALDNRAVRGHVPAHACAQAWRTVHPPPRGSWGHRPLAHVGFLKSWTRNDLNVKVTERVLRLLQTDCKCGGGAFIRVIVTGDAWPGTPPHESNDISWSLQMEAGAHAEWSFVSNRISWRACMSWQPLRCAGHSLGGALAQLAAHDIARGAQVQGLRPKVTCYTFGSPRVGNHAFAREYNKVRPAAIPVHALLHS